MRFNTSISVYQKALLKELGPDYRTTVFDLEGVIYRDLGTYDIEISGGHRKKQPFDIHVWLKAWPLVVERHRNLPHDHVMIKDLLDDIVERYRKMPVAESVAHLPEDIRDMIIQRYQSEEGSH